MKGLYNAERNAASVLGHRLSETIRAGAPTTHPLLKIPQVMTLVTIVLAVLLGSWTIGTAAAGSPGGCDPGNAGFTVPFGDESILAKNRAVPRS